MLRMGVSDNSKIGSCDVCDRSICLSALPRICLFGIGIVLLATVMLERAFAQHPPESESRWERLGDGITEGISGVALIEHDSAHTLLLAVHDNKSERQKRLSMIEHKPGKRAVWREVEWKSNLAPPDDRPPVDLEAICRIPGAKGEFVAGSSGGRLYRFRFVVESGEMKLIKTADLPGKARPPEIESFDLQTVGGKMLVSWAGRGNGNTPAILQWAEFDAETLMFGMPGKAEVRAVWPVNHARHITDLRVTPEGSVFGVATSDPGNDGPFASALYLLGRIKSAGQRWEFIPANRPTRLHVSQRHKIEALELIPGSPGGFILGSDDENAGGAILFAY
jgi:hypothetical protein